MSAPSRARADLLWLGVLGTVALLLQGLQDRNFFDGDTGYHLAVARYTRQYGVLHAFPWTPFSWLGKHYADKELALHLLMVPFAGLDINVASRLVGALLGSAVLWSLFGVLRAERVGFAGIWTLAALAASGAFVHRFVIVRPHLLSIALAVVIVWSASRGRWIALGLASVAYPFCYTAWHLPVVLGGLAALARLASGAGRGWPSLAIPVGAVGLGVLVHPNFPENARFFWIQNVEVLFETAWTDREGFELGGEFQPFSAFGLFRYAALPLAAAVGALVVQVRDRARDPLAMAATAGALGFFGMTLGTQRFVEYLVPLAALALAVSLGPRLSARWAAVSLAIAVAWTAGLGTRPIRMLQGRSIAFPPPVAEALQAAVPAGSQLFHCDWLAVGEMMLALPERRFLFALDPVLFYRGDPVAYRTWFSMLKDPPERPSEALRSVFDADFVLCDVRERWARFRAALESDPDIRGPLVAGGWMLYRVEPRAN